MRQTPELGRQLRQILVERFDEGGLKDLCFDLGVDYESLPDGGKTNKARELVVSCIHADNLGGLIQAGRMLRPDIAWPIIEAAPSSQTAARWPRKWILVTGTGSGASLAPNVAQTAFRLGQLLAAYGFGLMTGGWPGVDEHVARAFGQELIEHNQTLEDFLVQVLDSDQIPVFPGGDLRVVKAVGIGDWLRPSQEAWTQEVLAVADIVVVIEGVGGAMRIAKAALEGGKIVLPLADTGGDAKKLYWEMNTSWGSRTPAGMAHLTKKQFSIAAREAPAVVEDIIELLNKLYPIAPALGSAS